MKTLLAVIVLIVIAFFIFKKDQPATPVVMQDSVAGCYVATLGKDVYSLNIANQDDGAVMGTLVFDNFEKDSSAGTFTGSYQNGMILGDYSFQSEGMNSVMQVAFKKQGDDFVRGYGDVDAETGTRFTDVSAITYDTNVVFKKTDAACQTSLI